MDELAKLREQFKALQQQGSHHRLSERNCVELVTKLIASGQLQTYYTQDGKEYVTYEQLEHEIKDELLVRGGRVNVLDLQPVLNVDLAHIEAKVAELLKKDKRLQLINGEIITRYYLDGIAVEINEMLQEAGQLNLYELSSRFALPLLCLETVIEERLSRQIQGSLDSGALYTQVFVDRCKAQLRGVLAGITKPTPLMHIMDTYTFKEKLFYALIDQLKNEERLGGAVERGVYVPAIFSQTRQKWIESFFTQNGFIEYETLSKYLIPDPKKYMAYSFPDGVALATYFVNNSLIKRVEDALEYSVFENPGWLDITTIVDIPLSSKDGLTLLQACPLLREQSKKKAHIIVGDRYVVSTGFIERCMESFKDKIKKEAPLRMKEVTSKASSTNQGSLKGSHGKQQAKAKVPSKGARGKAKGKKARAKGEDEYEDEDGQHNTQNVALDSLLPDTEIENCLKEWYNDADEEFLIELAEYIKPSIRDLCRQITTTIMGEMASAKQKEAKELEKLFAVNYQNIQLFKISTEQFPDNYVCDILRRHLLATLCSETMNAIVHMQAVHYGLVHVKGISSGEERDQIIALLPLTVVPPLTSLAATLKGTSVEEFLTVLEKVANTLGLHLKKLDKKKLRTLAHTHKLDFAAQLRTTTDPTLGFHLAVVYLYAHHKGFILHIPSSAIQHTISHLQDTVDEETFSILKEFSAALQAKSEISAEMVAQLIERTLDTNK